MDAAVLPRSSAQVRHTDLVTPYLAWPWASFASTRRAGSTQSPSDSPHPAFRAGPPLNCAECAGENAMSQNSEPASQAVPSYSGAIPVSSPAEARQALDNVFSLTYEELRRLAYSVRRGDPSATLSPTALVNEAWLKLANSPGVASAPRLHFKRIAARAMRQLLVEAARRRHSQKRGGADDISVITFDESIMQTANCG